MRSEEKYLLAVNGGYSSIKLALYQRENPLKRRLYGKVGRIGLNDTTGSATVTAYEILKQMKVKI